ncbi:hypothetical protein NUW58_g8383 [Xylaria curta]|uniref:Uncharacterized protein n=1 Tax=Xylaria curta TaxID=42375 RepID=A0ACC1NA31_9PEZI|nr:hypothetical protein NUW58_g8383 [Xylaria curta]
MGNRGRADALGQGAGRKTPSTTSLRAFHVLLAGGVSVYTYIYLSSRRLIYSIPGPTTAVGSQTPGYPPKHHTVHTKWQSAAIGIGIGIGIGTGTGTGTGMDGTYIGRLPDGSGVTGQPLLNAGRTSDKSQPPVFRNVFHPSCPSDRPWSPSSVRPRQHILIFGDASSSALTKPPPFSPLKANAVAWA